tara:strand:+ start:1882 stop:2127 length:246 start_codon:yes stop_codon:yes gene_type:complete
MGRFFKKILTPLIWVKNLQGNIVEYLTIKLAKKTGADKPNKFKTWKLSQPLWKQFLIEVGLLGIFIYIIYLISGYIFIPIG